MVDYFKGINFDNTYTELPRKFYEKVSPTPVEHPQLVLFNKAFAKDIGLDVEQFTTRDGIEFLVGNKVFQGGIYISQAYAGHQFGHFTMLGDGRAILLGEHVTRDTEQRYDIQFKGSGRTPYSRGGDGRAGLGPMLREYLISEAMAHLGIPTTRGLAVISTGEMIHREQPLRGAVLTRVASSHLRVGTFQFARAYCSIKELKQLADYALQRHDPLLMLEEDCYVMFLENVVKRQAALVAQWQLIGFIHGVMNTDNMTISGETIDYGPCAFMDKFHPDTAFSSIDLEGRYKYSQQPQIAHWNLTRFAETLLPLIDPDEKVAINRAEQVIQQFPFYYMEYWLDGMRNKLGIFNEEDEDQTLFTDLLDLMTKYEADYTAVFIGLTTLKMDRLRLFNTEQFKEWYERYESRLKRQNQSKDDVIRLMKQHNPSIIPRNDFIEEALNNVLKNDNYEFYNKLIALFSKPYGYSKEQDELIQRPIPTKPYQTFCGT